jgi:shikimate dehydrogenase
MAEARALGFELVYELLDLNERGGPQALPQILHEVRQRKFLGVNITYPVKQAVLDLLDDASRGVTELGACNSVAFKSGHAEGHNTDWLGFSESFHRFLPGANLGRVAVLGAGGGAAACVYALLKMGAGRIHVCARGPARAKAMAARFNALMGEDKVVVASSLEEAMDRVQGVVNATPLGMAGHPGSPLPAALLDPRLWVSDLVYVPLRTELLQAAEARGCRIMEGGAMAVFQAAEAFRLFTGQTPDRDRMLRRFEADVRAERVG